MNHQTKFIEQQIRDKTRDIARTMRDYADRIERIADGDDLTYIPAEVIQTVINMQSNLRYDLPAVWLGQLMLAERAEAVLVPAQEDES